MKKLSLIAGLLMTASVMMAQNPIEIDLWQNGLPNTNGREAQGYNDETANFKPTIWVYLPKSETPTKAVVICPGGGYGHLAMQHEGHDWGDFFRRQKVAAIVLRYRMPYTHDDVPQSDAYEAIRLVKQHAAEWNINPAQIGIMGFSAGGHLASTVATHAKAEVRPAFQILIYPVISMDTSITHMGTHDNLIGKQPSAEMEKLYSNELQVSAATPHAFLALSDDDTTVPSMNSIRYYTALKQHGVPADLHIYTRGGHGWGIRPQFEFHTEFLMELKTWLRSF